MISVELRERIMMASLSPETVFAPPTNIRMAQGTPYLMEIYIASRYGRPWSLSFWSMGIERVLERENVRYIRRNRPPLAAISLGSFPAYFATESPEGEGQHSWWEFRVPNDFNGALK